MRPASVYGALVCEMVYQPVMRLLYSSSGDLNLNMCASFSSLYNLCCDNSQSYKKLTMLFLLNRDLIMCKCSVHDISDSYAVIFKWILGVINYKDYGHLGLVKMCI